MDLIDILHLLITGNLAAGTIITSEEGITFELQTDGFYRITPPGEDPSIWDLTSISYRPEP